MTGDHARDLELVRGVLEGRRAAVRAFSERMRCVGRILAARNRRLGSPLAADELEDVAQETALLIWKKLATYEGRAALETWVFRFCAFEHTSALRRRSRQPISAGEPPEVAVEAEPTKGADTESFDALMRHLSPREAEVTRLRHVDQLSYQEIAEALRITPSSAKTHHARGLEKLRAVLETAGEGRA